ncbi:hypothetical protein OAF54_01730 [bacterium]|nr:hypothetical protein [bacterium]
MDQKEIIRRKLIEQSGRQGCDIERCRLHFTMPPQEELTEEEYKELYSEEVAKFEEIGEWVNWPPGSFFEWDKYDYRDKNISMCCYANEYVRSAGGQLVAVRDYYPTKQEALDNVGPGISRTAILLSE